MSNNPKIKYAKERSGNIFYPRTVAEAIRFKDGESLETKVKNNALGGGEGGSVNLALLVASEQEAREGTSNEVLMTPLRTKQLLEEQDLSGSVEPDLVIWSEYGISEYRIANDFVVTKGSVLNAIKKCKNGENVKVVCFVDGNYFYESINIQQYGNILKIYFEDKINGNSSFIVAYDCTKGEPTRATEFEYHSTDSGTSVELDLVLTVSDSLKFSPTPSVESGSVLNVFNKCRDKENPRVLLKYVNGNSVKLYEPTTIMTENSLSEKVLVLSFKNSFTEDEDVISGEYIIKCSGETNISNGLLNEVHYINTLPKTKTSQLENDSKFITKEDIPEAQVPDLTGYAKESYVREYAQPKGNYLTEHQSLVDYAKKSELPTKASDVEADPSGTAESKVSSHNTSDTSHSDIRLLIEGLTTRLNTLANSDDITLDQMGEVVAYIKNNKSLIDGITTNKVNVSDIIDNLTTSVTNKPLSAKQGVQLKALIDAIVVPTLLSQLSGDTNHRTVTDAQISSWNSKSNFSGKYEDLSGQPTIPTKMSQLDQDVEIASGDYDLIIWCEYPFSVETCKYLFTMDDGHNKLATVHNKLLNGENVNIAMKNCDYGDEARAIHAYAESNMVYICFMCVDIEYDYIYHVNVCFSGDKIRDDYVGYASNTVTEIIASSSSFEGMATETYVQNKIAEAKLEGEGVDLTGYATKDDLKGYAKTSDIPTTASQVGADQSGTATTKVAEHNVSDTSHNDIRLLIEGLTTRLNTLANSDDTTLDQMAEVVTYIKNNKSLIDGITTSKVNVSDIIDNLTSSVSNKPLSAKQGVALKSLIDAIVVPTLLSQLGEDATHRTVTDTEKSTWNAKSNFSGKFSDLSGKPTTLSGYGITDGASKEDLAKFGGTVEVTSGNPSKENTVLTLNPNAEEVNIYTVEEVDTLVNSLLAEITKLKKAVPKVTYVTLTSSAWGVVSGEEDTYSQVVNISGVTDKTKVAIDFSLEQTLIFKEKNLAFVIENDNGVVTFYAVGQKPQNDYTLQITLSELMEVADE